MEHPDENLSGKKRKRTSTSRKGKEKVNKHDEEQGEEEEEEEQVENEKMNDDEKDYHSKQGYIVTPHAAKYNIMLAESSVEGLKFTPHATATIAEDGKSVLMTKLTFMAEMSIEEFYTHQKAMLVAYLRKILPPEKHLYPNLMEKTPTNEFIAMVYDKIVPEYKKSGLDTVLMHILAVAGSSKEELGDTNYAGVKKFLETFCRLTIKIMPQEQKS